MRTHEGRQDAGAESAGDALQQLQLGAVTPTRRLIGTVRVSERRT